MSSGKEVQNIKTIVNGHVCYWKGSRIVTLQFWYPRISVTSLYWKGVTDRNSLNLGTHAYLGFVHSQPFGCQSGTNVLHLSFLTVPKIIGDVVRPLVQVRMNILKVKCLAAVSVLNLALFLMKQDSCLSSVGSFREGF